MSMLSRATDTEEANRIVRSGWAGPGDLIVWKPSGQLYKVTKARQVKYAAVDEDGRDMLLPFRGCEAAPVGAEFAGPEKSRNQLRQEERVAQANELGVGTVVEMIREKDRAQYPGTYLITKRTSATRFKLVGVGSGTELTSPASLIRKAERGQ